MKPEEYGEKYQDHLLEQYKLFVEMADRVSQRRDQSNRFYVTFVSAIAGLLMVLARFGTSVNGIWPVVFLISGLLGMALSFIWFLNIKSYRTLNSAKFEIINDLERQLPYPGYAKEWELASCNRLSQVPPTDKNRATCTRGYHSVFSWHSGLRFVFAGRRLTLQSGDSKCPANGWV
jgi:hypothetical protein